LILGAALAPFSITIAPNIVDRATRTINEFEEIRKRDLAMAIYIARNTDSRWKRCWAGGDRH